MWSQARSSADASADTAGAAAREVLQEMRRVLEEETAGFHDAVTEGLFASEGSFEEAICQLGEQGWESIWEQAISAQGEEHRADTRACMEGAHQRWRELRGGLFAAAALAAVGNSAAERKDARVQAEARANAVWAELREAVSVACAVGAAGAVSSRKKKALMEARKAQEEAEQRWGALFHEVFQASCQWQAHPGSGLRFLPQWPLEQCDGAIRALKPQGEYPSQVQSKRRVMQQLSEEVFCSNHPLEPSAGHPEWVLFGSEGSAECWAALADKRQQSRCEARLRACQGRVSYACVPYGQQSRCEARLRACVLYLRKTFILQQGCARLCAFL